MADGAQPAAASETDCGALLASLREAGAARLDPLRWHYLERLHARALAQPAAVQRVLQGRLALALADYRQRLDLARQKPGADSAGSAQLPLQPAPDKSAMQSGAAGGTSEDPAVTTGSALGALLRALAQQAAGHGAADLPEPAGGRSELKSVSQFRNTWSKLSADKQLSQALDQAPKNAGPINSHMLVLRSLALMREASPDYLNRFISYADTLLCLEQAGQERAAAKAAKPAEAGAAGSKPKARRSRA